LFSSACSSSPISNSSTSPYAVAYFENLLSLPLFLSFSKLYSPSLPPLVLLFCSYISFGRSGNFGRAGIEAGNCWVEEDLSFALAELFYAYNDFEASFAAASYSFSNNSRFLSFYNLSYFFLSFSLSMSSADIYYYGAACSITKLLLES